MYGDYNHNTVRLKNINFGIKKTLAFLHSTNKKKKLMTLKASQATKLKDFKILTLILQV